MSNYYEANAEEFFTSTKDVDMTPLYEKFLPLIPSGGHILDAGCGSGRDSKYFLSQGYRVTAIEPTKTLSELASTHIGQEVEQRMFKDIREVKVYEGIWACASLLHILREELREVLEKLLCALKSEGVLYCSFKYGSTQRKKDGRLFTDMNEGRIQILLDQLREFYNFSHEIWISEDRRKDLKKGSLWLNILICNS